MAGEQDWSRFNSDDFIAQMAGNNTGDYAAGKPVQQPVATAPSPAADAAARGVQASNPAAQIVQPAQPMQLGLPGLGGSMPWQQQSTPAPQSPINYEQAAADIRNTAPPAAQQQIDLLANRKAAQVAKKADEPGYVHSILSGAVNMAKEAGSWLKDAGVSAANDPAAVGRQALAQIPNLGATVAHGFGALADIAERNAPQALDTTVQQLNPILGVVNMLSDRSISKSMGPGLRAGGDELQTLGSKIGVDKSRQNNATQIADIVGQITGMVAASVSTAGAADIPMFAGMGADMMDQRVKADGKQGTPEGDFATVLGAPIAAVTAKIGFNEILKAVPASVRESVLGKIADIASTAGANGVAMVGQHVLQNLTAVALLKEHPEANEGSTAWDRLKHLSTAAFDGTKSDFEGGAAQGALARSVLMMLGGRGGAISTNPDNLPAVHDDGATGPQFTGGDPHGPDMSAFGNFHIFSGDNGDFVANNTFSGPHVFPTQKAAARWAVSNKAAGDFDIAALPQGGYGLKSRSNAGADTAPEAQQSGEPMGAPAGEGPGAAGPAPAPSEAPFTTGQPVTVQQKDGAVNGTVAAVTPVRNPMTGQTDHSVTIKLANGGQLDQLASTLAQSGIVSPQAQPDAPAPQGMAPTEAAPVSPIAPNDAPGAGEPVAPPTPTPAPPSPTQVSAPAAEGGMPADGASAPLEQQSEGGQVGGAPTTSLDDTPPTDLADAVRQKLAHGGSYGSVTELRKEASQFYGAKVEGGTDQGKKAEEQAELGVVMAARDIVHEGDDPAGTYSKLVDLYDRQPNFKSRSSTSITNQAYSTPAPLAYVASRLAGVDQSKTVYEPTAGNGMLLIEADPANVHANELNPDRVEALQRLYSAGVVTQGDALHHSPDGQFDVVISNPPFGARKRATSDGRLVNEHFDNKAGFPTDQIDHAIAMSALQHMKPDGKAVLIVGARRGTTDKERVAGYRQPNQIRFYRQLFSDYNVTDLFTVDGSLYAKQGAEWPVNVIVIDGKGGQSSALPPFHTAPKVYSTWADLGEKVDGSVYSPEQQAGLGDGNGEVATDPAGQPEGVSDAAGGSLSVGDHGVGAESGTGRSVGAAGDAGGVEPDALPASQEDRGTAGGTQSDAPRSGSVSSDGHSAEDVPARSGDAGSDRSGERGGVAEPAGSVDVAKTFAKEGKSGADKLVDLAASGNKDAQGLIDRLTAEPKPEITVLPNTAKTVLVSDPSKRLEKRLNEALPKASIDYSAAKEGWIIPTRWVDQLKKSFDVVEDSPHTDETDAQIKAAQLEAEKARAERERMEAERLKDEQSQKHEAIDAGFAENRAAIGQFKKGDEVQWTNSDWDGKGTPRTFTGTVEKLNYTGKEQGMVQVRMDHGGDYTVGARHLQHAEAEQQAPSHDDINAAIDAALDERFGKKGAPQPTEAAKAPRERTAGEAAKSAAKNAGGGLADATRGLLDLFNEVAKDNAKTANMGIRFDPKTYEKAKPHFRSAFQHFKDMLHDIADMARALVRHLAESGMGREAIEAMKPYLARFIEDVRSGVEKLGGATKRTPKANNEAETEYQVQYKPASDADPVGTLVPISMQHALDDAFAKLKSRVGDINDFVGTELGYTPNELNDKFSAEQVDALALAIDNVKDGKGFIIGDQTGVGKGRFVAGMLRWGLQHNQTPVFVTKDAGLYADMVRDLRDIGMDSVIPQIFVSNRDLRGKKAIPLSDDQDDLLRSPANDPAHKSMLEKIAKTGKLPGPYKVYFTTYSQNQYSKGKRSIQMDALEGLSHNAMLVMDESHLAGGAAVERAKMDDEGNIINRSGYFRRVISKARSAVYSSATYAKNPHTMTLYNKTDIGLVGDQKSLPAAIERGGVPLQQVVANMLVDAGQYVRRERTFAGVDFGMKPIHIDEQRAEKVIDLIRSIFDLDVAVMQDARAAFIEHLSSQGEIAAGEADGAVGSETASGTNFAAVMHNVANQMLLALKATSIGDWAVSEMKAGRKPLIALVNTNDAILGDYIEEAGISMGDKVNVPFNTILERYIDRLRRISVKDKETEKSRYYWMTPDDIDDFIGPEAKRAYERAKDAIRAADLGGLSATPIDTIMDHVRAAGYKVDEITGRQRTLDKGVLRPREASNANKKRVMNGFNSGKLDALVLNVSGSTGYSMHAQGKVHTIDGNEVIEPLPGKNDAKQRSMMIAQPDPDINVFMQMLGRIHRTGQVQLPRYTIATSNLAVERRVAALLMNKMASLNANTTANAEGATTLKNVVNFINPIGDKVVYGYLSNHPDIASALDINMDKEDAAVDLARKFTGRTLLLPPKVAEEVLDTIQSEYQATIDSLDALGQNTLSAPVLDLDAKTVSKREFVPGQGEDSPFAAPAYVEEVDTRKLGRPMKPDEIKAEIEKVLNGAGIPGNGETGGVRPQRWSEKLRDQLDDMMPVYLDGVREDLKKAEAAVSEATTDNQRARAEGRVANWNSRINQAEDRLQTIKDAISMFRPGQRFSIRYDGDYQVMGVSLGVKSRVTTNPTTASAFTVEFAVADATRKLPIPLSQILSDAEDKPYEVTPIGRSWDDTMKEFDQPDDVREKRTVFTGNIFAAYSKLPKGQIIQMRRDDGSLESAVLMRRGFDLKKELADADVKFASVDHIRQFLDTVPYSMVSSIEPQRGAIQIVRRDEWSRGEYTLRVGGRGAKTFANKIVSDRIGGGDFNRAGERGQFRKNVNADQLAKAVETYQAMGVEFGANGNKEEARDIADPEAAKLMKARKVAAKSPTRSVIANAQDRNSLAKDFAAELDSMGLRDIAIHVRRYIDPKPFDAERVEGFYDNLDRLIVLARDAENLRWTLGHEVIHAMRDMDLFTKVEWRTLANSLPPETLRRIKRLYPELNDEGQIEEAIAEKFGEYFSDNPTAPQPKGFFRLALQKMKQFFEAVRRTFGMNDYDPTDPDQVMSSIHDGYVGRRSRMVRRQGANTYGPRARKTEANDPAKKAAAEAAKFADEETESRWQRARDGVGATGETWLGRAKTHFTDWARNFSRHWQTLPNDPRFSDVMQQLRKLEAAPENAREDILRYLKDLTSGFDRDDMEVFARKVVLDDLMFDLSKDRDLPFGFTPETLREAHNVVSAAADKMGLTEAVTKRRLVVQAIANDMVKWGVLTKEQVENPSYYRHMVLDYAAAAVTVARDGKSKTVRKPYWHGRKGSVRDINANILEAEMDWLYKALVDIKAAQTIDWIKKSPLNIRRQVTTQARAHNDLAMSDMLQADIEANGYDDGKGGMTSALNEKWNDFNRRIAVGVDGVRKALVAGAITNIPAQLRASADAIMNRETSDEGFFDLFAWIMDNDKAGAAGAGAAFNAINGRREFMQTSLGKDFANTRDIDSLIRKGFAPEGYSVWQPDPGKVMFTSKVISEHALDRFAHAVAGEGFDIPEAVKAAFKDQARDVLMVGGDKHQFIIPTELANTLDKFSDRRTEDMLQNLVTHMSSAWKRWTLFAPRRVIKYVTNNFSGDIDAIIAGNPGTLKKLRQATREVIAVHKGGDPSADYLAARERAVFGSALTAQEVKQIEKMDEFKSISRAENDTGLPMRLARSYFRKVMALNNGRETILRYAAYLDYIEKIHSGVPIERIGFGASNPAMVKAVTDPQDRAALLSRDLLGDYGSISYNGAKLRRGLMPFFSWMEINTKRYWRLTANAWNTGRGKGIMTGAALATSAALRRGLWLGARMALLFGSVHLYNHMFFPAEEAALSAQESSQMHVFIPSWDGETKSIRLQGALDDALGWFGFGDASAAIDMAHKGQLTLNAVAKVIYDAPVNKVFSQLNPMIKVPIELASGQQLWPDLFQPYPVRDNWKHIFQTFSLDNEYVAANNVLADHGIGSHKATRGYFDSLAQTMVYSRDPGEIAYNRIRGLAARFEGNRTGDTGSSASSTTNSRLLYEYRSAMRYGDKDMAEKLHTELLNLRDPVDGRRLNSEQKIREAEKRLDPEYTIPRRYRNDFEDSLTPDEKLALKNAQQWYDETFR